MQEVVAKQRVLTPTELGMNGSTITAGNDYLSNTFFLKGVTDLTVFLNLDQTAVTALSVYLQYCPDENPGTSPTWYTLQSTAVAGGIATMTDYYLTRAGIGGDIAWACPISLKDLGKINAMNGRLKITNVGGAGVDTLTVTANLRYSI